MLTSRGKETPIFVKQKVNFVPTSPITHLTVANNHLVFSMQSKVILKIDLNHPEPKIEEIDLKKQSITAKISNLYLDPSGEHLLLSFSPQDSTNLAEFMYLPPNTQKLREVAKMKSHIVTSVAWSPSFELSSYTTLPFLLGTSKGLIFEAEISHGEFKYCKQVYDIGGGLKGSSSVISGLDFFFLPKSSKCLILVATAKKLYLFKGFIESHEGRPWFGPIFTNYLNQSSSEEFLEVPSTRQQSELCLSRLHVLKENTIPKAFGYFAEDGTLLYKKLPSNFTESDFLSNTTRIQLKDSDPENDEQIRTQKSLLLTEYHAMLLFKDSIKGICTLNEDIVHQESFDEPRKRIMNIVQDQIKGTLWCFTEGIIYRYVITNEDRNIWKIYLDKCDFDRAQEVCKNDPEKISEINMKHADFCFGQKEYEISAMYYALTKASFEEIALKFVQIDDSQALKTFLMKKLSSLNQFEMTKVTALVLWIIELYLNELGSLRDFGKRNTTQYQSLEEDFLQFMAQPIVKDCVTKNKKTVYDLMASHGDKENLIHFTVTMKDFDEVIENNIANGQYAAALATLQKQKDLNLYPKFIPILLDKDAKATINVLIDSGKMLNPSKLLPKFSSKLDEITAKEITRYLEHCVNNLGITDQPIHDYLLSLYVYFYNEPKILEYLKSQGRDSNRVRYDVKYALMLCLEKKLDLATIHLYTIMGLYEDAVSLAILVNLDLAKKTANMPEDDEELRKKLWLKIAKHVVKEKNEIKQAMEFLHECDLLRIEDILPFFPNFVTIDHFKDAICSSLQEYNQHIQTLKDEMEESTKAAEAIREDIQAVRNRCVVVRETDQCTLCGGSTLLKNFYVFPCGHQFHSDCLISEVYPQLSQPRRVLLQEYQKKLEDLTSRHEIVSTGSAMISAREQIKSDIDEIVAAECFYCGDNMIKLIDVPFINEEDYDRVQKEWE